ncbi:Nucleoside diphosphate kinase, mitochondrial [Manis javanica]|nr:Nucleoside diphosphate kinase, mitochondrial [Manis javanica]
MHALLQPPFPSLGAVRPHGRCYERGLAWYRNVIHASDSVEGAKREILLWFQSNELVDWADEGHHGSIYPA